MFVFEIKQNQWYQKRYFFKCFSWLFWKVLGTVTSDFLKSQLDPTPPESTHEALNINKNDIRQKKKNHTIVKPTQ